MCSVKFVVKSTYANLVRNKRIYFIEQFTLGLYDISKKNATIKLLLERVYVYNIMIWHKDRKVSVVIVDFVIDPKLINTTQFRGT